MKKSRFFNLFVILVTFLLALLAVTPVLADKPVHELETWEADWIDTEVCPGVELNAYIKVNSNHFLWFDQYGELHGESWIGVNNASVSYEGRTVRMRANGTFQQTILSFENGVAELYNMSTGTEWLATVPGYGVVAGNAGRETFNETCVWDPDYNEWDCRRFNYERSGMVFDQPGVVCDYLINGE